MSGQRTDDASPTLDRRERLIIAALRCWARGRAASRATMPRLFRLLAPLGAGMLVVTLNGFFELAEAHERRPLLVGRAGETALTGDEVKVLTLIRRGDGTLAQIDGLALGEVHGRPLLAVAAQITGRQVADAIGPVGEDTGTR